MDEPRQGSSPGRARHRAPLAVLLLVAALTVVAIAAGATADRLSGDVHVSAFVVLGLLASLTSAAYLHVQFRHGDDDIDALDLFEAALAPALFLVPGMP